MNQHRYTLEPYKGKRTRYRCPACNDRCSFTNYIDTETGLHIAENVGRCNRLNNCGYHYTPNQYFKENNIPFDTVREEPRRQVKLEPPKPISFIAPELFEKSLKNYEANNFVQYLKTLFSIADVTRLVERYYLGTAKQWLGANVFWQIDTNGNIRTGKIMLYNPETGKRVKDHINWAHSAAKLPDFQLKQCFYGEHLLKDNTKTVAIVESEKTAIIASMYIPGFVWLACGGLEGLSADKCLILKGRKVVLYPDLNGLQKWQQKAKELAYITRIDVSDLLEQKASETERQKGLDLADYLIRFDYLQFLQPEKLSIVNSQVTLKNQFKAEYLQEAELPPERQWPIWLDYRSRGLSPVDAKAVCKDLLENYGFVAV